MLGERPWGKRAEWILGLGLGLWISLWARGAGWRGGGSCSRRMRWWGGRGRGRGGRGGGGGRRGGRGGKGLGGGVDGVVAL